jgi:carbon monoxide dehydrogenase subunit G
MEHEAFVPFPADSVRPALCDLSRIARCVPGFRRDASEASGPLSGRLRLRIGGSTITYRGVLRVTERGEGIAVEGEGTQSRGGGSVRLSLTVVARPADGGTRVVCSGWVRREGRLAEFGEEAVAVVARRLWGRFVSALTSSLETRPTTAPEQAEQAEGIEKVEQAEGVEPAEGAEGVETARRAPEQERDGRAEAAEDAGAAAAESDRPGPHGFAARSAGGEAARNQDQEQEQKQEQEHERKQVGGARSERAPSAFESPFEAEVPPPSLDPLSDKAETADDLRAADAGYGADAADDIDAAEAAHARRTMIGRSTEEVDHAPPRGRYAPVPAPQHLSGGLPLRWAAPAAAVVLASAVVVARRVLRHRR